MSEQVDDGPVTAADVVDLVALGILEALSMPLSALSAVDLTNLLQSSETISRFMRCFQRRVIAEIDRRGVAGEYGSSSTSALIGQRLHLSVQDAAARVKQAREFAPRVALNGEVLDPLFAPTAAALDSGAISIPHAKIIASTRSDLPAKVDAKHGLAAEEFLVEQAKLMNPTQLGYVAQRLVATLNPDGKYTDEQDQQRKRHAGLIDLPDGGSKPTGYFTPELTAVLKPFFDSLGKTQSTEGMPDTRTQGQRVHDGLIEVGQKIMREELLPDSGGVPVSMLITATAEDIDAARAGRDPLVHDAYGTPLRISTVLAMGGEIELTGIRLSATGGIESFGQTRRLATPGQRRALAARDRGCSHPGCTRTHAWAEVHHIKEWLQGGGTDLSNLVLLCRFHHRHFEEAGWQVRMNPDDGLPEWIPPVWIDEEQRPRRNTVHDRPRIPTF